MKRAAIFVALLAGCSLPNSLDITVVLSPALALRVAEIHTIKVHVDGDSVPFDGTVQAAGKFSAGRATLQYLPKRGSGTVTMALTALDSAQAEVGFASAMIPISGVEDVTMVMTPK